MLLGLSHFLLHTHTLLRFCDIVKNIITFPYYLFMFVKGGQKMYEIFEQLLQSFNTTPYKVAKETGIAQSTLSDWKRGRSVPKQDKLQKIANFFGVSLEYLMTGREKEGGEKYYLNDETAEMAQALFENKNLRVLFDAAKDASPEDLKTTYDMLMALKKKERGMDAD